MILAHLVGKGLPIPCGCLGRKWLMRGSGVLNLSFYPGLASSGSSQNRGHFLLCPFALSLGSPRADSAFYIIAFLLQGYLPRAHSQGQEGCAGFSLNELRGQELLKGRHRTSEAGVPFSKCPGSYVSSRSWADSTFF